MCVHCFLFSTFSPPYLKSITAMAPQASAFPERWNPSWGELHISASWQTTLFKNTKWLVKHRTYHFLVCKLQQHVQMKQVPFWGLLVSLWNSLLLASSGTPLSTAAAFKIGVNLLLPRILYRPSLTWDCGQGAPGILRNEDVSVCCCGSSARFLWCWFSSPSSDRQLDTTQTDGQCEEEEEEEEGGRQSRSRNGTQRVTREGGWAAVLGWEAAGAATEPPANTAARNIWTTGTVPEHRPEWNLFDRTIPLRNKILWTLDH